MAASPQTVTATWRPYGVGIDCHSQFIQVCVLIPDTKTRDLLRYEQSFPVFAENIRRAKAWVLAALARHHQHPKPLVYALESTATYHYPVLRGFGETPIVINPGLAAQFKARKTDRWDAYVLAYQALTGLFVPSHVPDEETEVLRCLLRTRRKAKAEVTRQHNQIGIRLSQWYCPLSGDRPRSARIRAAVEDFAAGHKPDCTDLPCFAQASLVPAPIWGLLLGHYRAADQAQQLADRLQKQATELLPDPALCTLLQSVPGIGPLTALTWLAEVEPASRFPRAKHVVAYCGFDPTPMESAGKVVSTRCRKGNKHIRSLIVQAAHTVLNRASDPLAEWGRRLPKHRNVRVAAVGRRLVQALYHVSVTRNPYDPRGYRYGTPRPTAPGGAAADGTAGQRQSPPPLEEDL
jgi:transposase